MSIPQASARAPSIHRWPSTGIPPSPGAWITTTARNRAIDYLRRERSRNDRSAAALALVEPADPAPEVGPAKDDRLRRASTG